MEIVSIILRLKNQEIKVTAEEAKELFGQLSAIFGGPDPIIQKEYIPYPVYPDYPWWSKPWWLNQPTVIYSDGTAGKVTWSARGNSASYTVNDVSSGKLLDSNSYELSSTGWSLGSQAGSSNT